MNLGVMTPTDYPSSVPVPMIFDVAYPPYGESHQKK
jgi:hypothetical protein